MDKKNSTAKTVVITGGTDGLGKELAKILIGKYTIIILGRNAEKVESTKEELRCDGYVCDITSHQQINHIFSEIKKKYGSIFCLINNAGYRSQGPLKDNSYEEIEQLINTNVLGYLYCTKAALQIIDEKNCYIININSQAGLMSKKERSLYHCSKRAITGLTKSLQDEYQGTGIKVMGVYPGMMKTGFFEKVGITKSMDHAIEVSEVAMGIKYIIDAGLFIPEIGFQFSKK